MTSTTADFADKVKRLRQQLGLTQKDLANELGVSFATVNRWENEKTLPSKLAERQFEQLVAQRSTRGGESR